MSGTAREVALSGSKLGLALYHHSTLDKGYAGEDRLYLHSTKKATVAFLEQQPPYIAHAVPGKDLVDHMEICHRHLCPEHLSPPMTTRLWRRLRKLLQLGPKGGLISGLESSASQR